jgi:asparagine synthase (glutamine-hydrolysing)
MCGVVACLGATDPTPAADLLKHRGIRTKAWGGAVGSMVHSRLPIVSLGEESDQPIIKGRWVIGFVGEILDYKDWGFESDAELVGQFWYEHGAGAFRQHDGFWHILAIDTWNDTLHILGDYLAQKPCYYRTDGVVAAASDLDSIAALAPVFPDEVYFASVCKWGYCPERHRTPYSTVRKVLPGQYIVISKDGVMLHAESIDPLKAESTSHYTDLRTEIEKAVERRVLSSDVPVAALVSGGLDSSIVYHLARRHGEVKAYFADEGDAAEQLRVSLVVDTDPCEKITWGGVSTVDALRAMQEPIDLGSLKPQLALARQVKERVCLTGDGADEFFGGYGRAQRYDSQWSDVFHELVMWHLPRLDRVMMTNRVEVRSPFLARRVAQIALGLPRPLRTNKLILRDSFRDLVTPQIADQEKKPLRTKQVEEDREGTTQTLIDIFRRTKWP